MKFPQIYFTISTFCVLRNPSLTKAMIILSYTHIMFYLSHKSFIYIKLIFSTAVIFSTEQCAHTICYILFLLILQESIQTLPHDKSFH